MNKKPFAKFADAEGLMEMIDTNHDNRLNLG